MENNQLFTRLACKIEHSQPQNTDTHATDCYIGLKLGEHFASLHNYMAIYLEKQSTEVSA